MDISPPLSTSDAPTAFAASDLFARMLQDMIPAIPIRDLDTPQRVAQRHEDARTMAAALHPADVIEAATAILATVAYYASLALHASAAQPGQTAREATALCRVALAERRAHRSGVTDLAKRHAPAEPPRQRAERTRPSPVEPEAPDDDPIPHLPQFQPRNRHGDPIPLYRWQDMTPKQRRATYGDPYDTATQAIATEEEEEIIAAQKALAGGSAGGGADCPT
jgi:hypothetical protein